MIGKILLGLAGFSLVSSAVMMDLRAFISVMLCIILYGANKMIDRLEKRKHEP